jgi:ankyrin repeat domain-containing protein 50
MPLILRAARLGRARLSSRLLRGTSTLSPFSAASFVAESHYWGLLLLLLHRMADGLSVASGIAGLISLGLQTANALVQFYTSYKDRDANIARTTGRLESLATTFCALDANIQRRKFQPNEKSLIDQINYSVRHCEEAVLELQDECKKLTETSSGSLKSAAKVAGRRVAYPFRESTLKKLDENVGELRDGLSLALDVLQLQDNQTTQDDISEVRSLIELMRATQISSSIRDWLQAPDVSVNHYAACAKRHPGTGGWLVKGSVFRTWLTQENSFLWLNGFAGCGKSVLCSTAIQYAFRQRAAKAGIAFFYFTFNDESKQDESALLRALLSQLTGQLPEGDAILTRLRDTYKSGPPPAAVLIEHLRYVIQKFIHVYILIDALDESPRGGRRDAVLHSIRTIREWTWPGLHFLVTSRDILDIRESLYATRDQEAVMKCTEIDQDIVNFITEKLNTDLKLRRKWQAEERGRIQNTLAERAQGVYVI